MNSYSYEEAHGISFHSDHCSAYDPKDPITSFSMVNGSLLIITAKTAKKKLDRKWALVVYQPVNLYADHGRAFPDTIPARGFRHTRRCET